MMSMKTKFWIFISVLALALIIAALWRRSVQNTTEPIPTQQTAVPTNNGSEVAIPVSNMNIVTQGKDVVGLMFNTNVINTNPAASSQMQTTNSRRERLKNALESKNASIGFYGRVIDQESNSVPRARVVMRVRQWHLDATADPWGNEFPKFERVTDSNGYFSLENTTGDSLSIESVSKEGYRLSPKAQNMFGYGAGNVPDPFHPDPQNPVIIKMWKLGEQQQLVSHHLSGMGLPVDGSPVQFDLFNGTKALGGQLIVRLKREPQVLPPHGPRYNWSLELGIPNGGLIADNDEFMYLAPESGYQTVFKFDMPKEAENWTTAINQQFYIELGDGKYFGSLVIHLSTIHDTPPLGLTLDIILNPNGSRNLQP
jgi:hypothetical protein